MGMCTFGLGALPNVDSLIGMLRAVTGWAVTEEELLRTGERIANVRQAFNFREGLNPLRYSMPGRIVGVPPKAAGPSMGVTVDEDTLDREYLRAMDWDIRTAKPSRRKLLALGLDDVARQLWPAT